MRILRVQPHVQRLPAPGLHQLCAGPGGPRDVLDMAGGALEERHLPPHPTDDLGRHPGCASGAGPISSSAQLQVRAPSLQASLPATGSASKAE